jgi:hypothetical protein
MQIAKLEVMNIKQTESSIKQKPSYDSAIQFELYWTIWAKVPFGSWPFYFFSWGQDGTD